jgi:hypothetical protein
MSNGITNAKLRKKVGFSPVQYVNHFSGEKQRVFKQGFFALQTRLVCTPK